jgi:hypothetical protein
MINLNYFITPKWGIQYTSRNDRVPPYSSRDVHQSVSENYLGTEFVKDLKIQFPSSSDFNQLSLFLLLLFQIFEKKDGIC